MAEVASNGQIAKLEAKQRALRKRLVAERRALRARSTRERAAVRVAHEQALAFVLRSFVLDAVTPQAFEAMLMENGFVRKRAPRREREAGR